MCLCSKNLNWRAIRQLFHYEQNSADQNALTFHSALQLVTCVLILCYSPFTNRLRIVEVLLTGILRVGVLLVGVLALVFLLRVLRLTVRLKYHVIERFKR